MIFVKYIVVFFVFFFVFFYQWTTKKHAQLASMQIVKIIASYMRSHSLIMHAHLSSGANISMFELSLYVLVNNLSASSWVEPMPVSLF